MGLFGKILSTPFKIVNAPIRAMEDLLNTKKCDEEVRIFSKPLDFLSDQLEDIDDDD